MMLDGKRKNVLAIVPWEHRNLLRGISAYANYEGLWHLEVFPPSSDFVTAIHRRKPDGVLIAGLDDNAVKQVKELVPFVVGIDTTNLSEHRPQIEVNSDDLAVGQAGAEHLLAMGHGHYAFVGIPNDWVSGQRWRGFQAEIARKGYNAELYEISWDDNAKDYVPADLSKGSLSNWLLNLPKPAGIMGWGDGISRVICRACRDCGLRVPDEIAVIGSENDDLMTEMSDPPLSSVVVPWRQIGNTAAAMLDRLMNGATIKNQRQFIPPSGVEQRQSTGAVSVADQEVRDALFFMRDNVSTNFNVDDVVTALSTTRRALERKFRAVLGRSPLEEIRRIRIERARQLLMHSDLPLKQLAERCGFTSASWFNVAFRQVTGQSPGAFRRHVKGS